VSATAKCWDPLWPRLEPIIAAKQPNGRLPRANESGWIDNIHSPLREDRHASFSVRPDSENDPGAWKDHATGEGGSIAELARKFDVLPFPRPYPVVVSHARSLEGFANKRHLDAGFLRRICHVREVTFKGRPALRYPTGKGDRVKFLDGDKPKYMWVGTGGAAHWYGIKGASKIGGRVIYIVNGEVSVWAAQQARVAAVCLCVGEGALPTLALIEQLRETGFEQARVVYDRDQAGRSGALRLVEALRAGGLNARALELPADLGEGGDVDDLHRKVGRELGKVLEGLPELQPPPPGGVGILLADVQPEDVQWLWQGRIPLGKICLLDGDPGLGKSTVTLDLAARVSTGMEMPDRTPGVAGGVVLLSAEDGLADTVRPRLLVHGADLTKILALQQVGAGDNQRLVALPEDLPSLREAIDRVGAKLVVIDPLMAFLGAKVNSHHDQDVRRALAAMAALAQDTGAATVIVRHLNKNAGGNPLYRGGGSIGIIGAARAGLLVARHPQIESQRVLALTKSNLAREAASLEFILDDIGGTPRVRWLGDSELTAADLLAQDQSSGGGRGTRNEEKEFLAEMLADGEPIHVQRVKQEAVDAGFSARSIERAAKDLGIVKRKVGRPGEADQQWTWELPAEDDHEAPKAASPGGWRSSGEVASFEAVEPVNERAQ
jgi:hypothetical protein